MKVLVARRFPYAANGLKSIWLEEGDEPDIRDELIPGLEQEGFIVVDLPLTDEQKAAAAAAARAAIAIPDDWQTMHKTSLKSLAGKLSGTKVEDADEALKVVGAEVEARAAAPGAGQA